MAGTDPRPCPPPRKERPRLTRPLLCAVVLLALVLAAAADPAQAHTRLLRKATSDRAITLTFATPVAADATEIDILAQRGGDIEVAPVRNVPGDPASVTLPIRGRLWRATYFVTWSTTNDDGHVVSGVFDFTLRAGTAPVAGGARVARPAAPGTPRATSAALSFARIVQDGALALAFGLVVFLGAVWRGAAARLRPLLLGAAIAGAASAALATLLQSTQPGDFLSTRADGGWALTALLWLGVAATARRSAGGVPAAALVTALVLTPPLRGHGGVLVVIHVAAVSAWVGGLVALLTVVRAVAPGERPALIARFGAVALPCATIVATTGVLQGIVRLDALEQLATTGYGRLVVLKLVLLLGMVAFAARRTFDREVAVSGLALGAAGLLAGMAPPG